MTLDSEFVRDLTTKDLARIPGFITPNQLRALNQDFENLFAQKKFRAAGVGHREKLAVEESIRGDKIFWWDPDALTPSQSEVYKMLEGLRTALNENLVLGLWDMELHYAVYSPGSRYDRHIDAFQDDPRRMVSFILYLNENWNPDDGGQLRVHFKTNEFEDVLPTGGNLVLFMSHSIEHEVLETKSERRSLTGWFRRRI